MDNNEKTQDVKKYHQFGKLSVDIGLVRFWFGVFLCLVVLAVAVVRSPLLELPESPAPPEAPQYQLRFVEVEKSRAAVEFMRTNGLWELGEKKTLPPLVFTSFPSDIEELRVSQRKQLFLHALAPVALVALAEVAQERAELLRVIARMDFAVCSLEQLLEMTVDYQECGLSTAEAAFLLNLADKYRTTELDLLLKRVDLVPLSLVLAQAAMESAWGSSRFVQEGNNIFGVWTWSGEGMVPANRAEGMTHRVASYDSLLDSVRAYLLMLNRVGAYRTLRDIRLESMNSLALVNGLRYYSEKRDLYVDDLRRLIRVNKLQRYDHLTLALPPA